MVIVEGCVFSAAGAAIPKVDWKRSKMKHWFSYETIHLVRHIINKCGVFVRLSLQPPIDGWHMATYMCHY